MHHLFTQHPNSVGESYFEHMGTALMFAAKLTFAATACLVHGIFPFLCVKTGSHTVLRLHEDMITHRSRLPEARPAMGEPAE